ncbi:hypothetical protein [Celeribacter sp. SCSIO 80788]|jgi:Protein of unknown function (DUF2846).|uniref:hypothetical protein n=1 Tax=Celeribacter sp. SCSIO 80788 TaxID=3117013 RepID=UPI003DA533CE
MIMRCSLKTVLMGLGLFVLAGCDTSQQSPLGEEDVYASSPDGQTRLVIFRDDYSGLLIQPKVYVDGQHVATCTPGTATTVAVLPGSHRVSGATLKERSINVDVPNGKTTYVSCAVGFGVLVGKVEFTHRFATEAAPKVAKMRAIVAE